MYFIYAMYHSLVFLLSGLLAYCMYQLVLWVFPKLGLMDRPERYGLERAAVPYPAGIGLVLAFVVAALIFVPLSLKMMVLLGSVLVLVLISAIDDRIGLPAWFRLLVQAILAYGVTLSGVRIEEVVLPFFGVLSFLDPVLHLDLFGQALSLYPLADLLTVLWIVTLMNAINFLDGIPGLVSGLSSIAYTTMYMLSLFLIALPSTTIFEKLEAEHVALLSCILLGVTLIFQRFDRLPAKFIIGDSGAMFLGFTIAVLSIISGGKVATTLIVLALPLVDMVWVVTRRIIRGKSPFAADHNHLHHKLQRLGYSKNATLKLLYAWSSVLAVVALGLLFAFQGLGKLVALLILLVYIFSLSSFLIRKEEQQSRGF